MTETEEVTAVDHTETLENPPPAISSWANGTPTEEMDGPSLKDVAEAQAKAQQEPEQKAVEQPKEEVKEAEEVEVDADALKLATDFLTEREIKFEVKDGKILYDTDKGVTDEDLTAVMKGETEEEPALSWEDVKSAIQSAVPGAVISAEEGQELSAAVNDYVAELADRGDKGEQYASLLQDIADEYEPFRVFLGMVMDPTTPVSPRVAAAQAFKGVTLDPEEDPEAYADAKVADALRKRDTEQNRAKDAQRQERTDRFMRDQKRSYGAFEQKMKGAEGFDYGSFLAEAASVVEGDPRTGKARADAPEILYRGLNFDAMAKEVADAAVAAKLKELAKPKEKEIGAPTVLTGESSVEQIPRNLSPQQQTVQNFAKKIGGAPTNPYGIPTQGA